MPTPRRHSAARDHLKLLTDSPGAPVAPRDEQARPGRTNDAPGGAVEATFADDALDQATLERATGMLMAYYGLPARTAGLVLQRWAREAGIPPAELSAGLVAVGSRPSLHPFGALRRALRTYALDMDAES